MWEEYFLKSGQAQVMWLLSTKKGKKLPETLFIKRRIIINNLL